MNFEYNGAHYRIVFRRELYEPSAAVSPTAQRMQTQALLFQEVGTLADGKAELKELGRASVRAYFKDDVSREEGRKKALQRLTPFISPELRPIMWQTYLNRPRLKTEKQ